MRSGPRARRARALTALVATAVAMAATAACALTLPGAGTSVAVAGWVSGDEAKQRLRRGAAGAGVPQLAAGAAGYYMDVLEGKLREQVDRSGAAVARRGDEVTLSVPAAVAFVADGTDLTPAADALLDGVASLVGHYDKTVIEVAGHSDDAGDAARSEALTAGRAQAVASYLEHHGVAHTRIVAIGAGATHPVARNDAAGRVRNRRVELTIAPLVRATG
ncbi:MAG: OmpA family protein [Proteobacteria bacterium]|nr:OmpA family protein [Pseudomonadota bacterium]